MLPIPGRRTIRCRRVLAVGLFVLFWIVLAIGLFLLAVAPRAAPGRLRYQRGSNRAVGLMFTFFLIVFGIGLPAALLIGNHNRANGQVGGITLDLRREAGSRAVRPALRGLPHAGGRQRGRQGRPEPRHDQAVGVARPAHDRQRLPPQRAQRLRRAVPGSGRDAADVVTGRNAEDVANFVAKVAGNE